MLESQLNRIYALVGEITTAFNSFELGWYLIFTALLPSSPRTAVDAIFQQHKTGGAQRKLISDVALALRKELESKSAKSDQDEVYSEAYDNIVALCKVTETLAGRRNEVIHSLFYIANFTIPPMVLAGNISKRSALADKKIDDELTNLLGDIEYHALDIGEVRLKFLELIHPPMIVARDRQLLEAGKNEVAKKYPRK
jgi:hypothetical protein